MSKATSVNHDDIIKIVPLHNSSKTATANPQLTYRGGPLLANVEVFTVFWGTHWSARSAEMGRINNFFHCYTQKLINATTE